MAKLRKAGAGGGDGAETEGAGEPGDGGSAVLTSSLRKLEFPIRAFPSRTGVSEIAAKSGRVRVQSGLPTRFSDRSGLFKPKSGHQGALGKFLGQ